MAAAWMTEWAAVMAAAVLATNVASAAPTLESVRFTSYDIDRFGAPVELAGQLLRPEGSTGRRMPAVIAVHGCGGMYSVLQTRRDELSIRHRRMAELLTGEGYAVFFPDSFRNRGRDEVCTQKLADRSITQRHRKLDILGALSYLQGRADIDAARIAILGWSHGGSAVLTAVNARDPQVQQFRGASPAYFRTAVAFYPGCEASAAARIGFAPAAPLLLLVGASDDWTSPQPCIRLAERLRAAHEPVSIVVYPDTYHGFDGPDGEPRRRLDVPNGVRPGQGVTTAVNREAREDAYARVRQVMRQALSAP